ncbi:hypothetical protein JCM6882_005330 [Rhodosporidiobolus microsporus]
MDSPPPSSVYVPVSLQDTLTQRDRTYRSAKTAAPSSGSTTASRPGPRPSHAAGHGGSFNAKERADAARREAAAMMATLGMPAANDVEATPRPERSFNSAAAQGAAARAGAGGASSIELAALRAQLSDRDDELAAAWREVGVLQREKKELQARVDKLEREKKEGGGNAGLDVRQLEELEAQFAQQEVLLAGYQKEAEKSAQELDSLRNRQRRVGDFLERTYGRNWAEDLELGDKRTNGSPVVRKKLVARASLAHSPSSSSSVPTLSRLNTDSSSSSSIFETPTHSTSPSVSYDEPASPSHAPTASTSPPSSAPPSSTAAPLTLDPSAVSALKQHLESVQALLRSMETRLIARDAELLAVEKRAREEREKASGRAGELEGLVRRLEEQLGVAQA